jgi:hypothetical protein
VLLAGKERLMAMTQVNRDHIMLLFALTECGSALANLDEVDRLANVREQIQPGVERRARGRIFDHIRLALQMAANVSRLFWPATPGKPNTGQRIARDRGVRLRSVTGLPETHGLRSRTLRNHIEHLDERLDAWTETSPRPFLGIQFVVHDDEPSPGAQRDELIDATAIVYDTKNKSVQLFGDCFLLLDLRVDLEEVHQKISESMSVVRGPGWRSIRG